MVVCEIYPPWSGSVRVAWPGAQHPACDLRSLSGETSYHLDVDVCNSTLSLTLTIHYRSSLFALTIQYCRTSPCSLSSVILQITYPLHLVTHVMFSSFSSFSLPFAVPRFLGGNPGPAVDIHPVDVHDIETKHEKPARTLKHLLKLNHVNHSIVYHNLEFHNHMPHVCASAVVAILTRSISATDPRISLPSGG